MSGGRERRAALLRKALNEFDQTFGFPLARFTHGKFEALAGGMVLTLAAAVHVDMLQGHHCHRGRIPWGCRRGHTLLIGGARAIA
jgi:hypothetical protein